MFVKIPTLLTAQITVNLQHRGQFVGSIKPLCRKVVHSPGSPNYHLNIILKFISVVLIIRHSAYVGFPAPSVAYFVE